MLAECDIGDRHSKMFNIDYNLPAIGGKKTARIARKTSEEHMVSCDISGGIGL